MINKRKIAAHKERLPSALHPLLKLNVDKAHGDPATYKPLLALIMLMRLKYEGTEELSYREVRHVLPMIMAELSKPSKNPDLAANPFWLLQNDGVWEVRDANGVPIEEKAVTSPKGGGRKGIRPKDSKLRAVNPLGSFSDEVLLLLNRDPDLIDAVAKAIMDVFLGQIVAAVGMKRVRQVIGFYETPGTAHLQFSKNVYRAYQSQCSVSQRSIRLFNRLVDIHATPLRPDTVLSRSSASSGIALSGKYDLLFRCGAITLRKKDEGDYRVQATKYRPKNHKGQPGIIIYRLGLPGISKLDGKRLLLPKDSVNHPDSELLKWHQDNVFLG